MKKQVERQYVFTGLLSITNVQLVEIATLFFGGPRIIHSARETLAFFPWKFSALLLKLLLLFVSDKKLSGQWGICMVPGQKLTFRRILIYSPCKLSIPKLSCNRRAR